MLELADKIIHIFKLSNSACLLSRHSWLNRRSNHQNADILGLVLSINQTNILTSLLNNPNLLAHPKHLDILVAPPKDFHTNCNNNNHNNSSYYLPTTLIKEEVLAGLVPRCTFLLHEKMATETSSNKNVENIDQEDDDEEEVDPFEQRIDNSGCSKFHYALQVCMCKVCRQGRRAVGKTRPKGQAGK